MRVPRLTLSAALGAVAAAVACLAPQASASTIAVANLSDSGAGSLRDAIATASPGDTITIPSGQITLTSAPLAISKDLTIAGTGAGTSVISGNDAWRVLTITGAPTVTLDPAGVPIRRPQEGLGGGPAGPVLRHRRGGPGRACRARRDRGCRRSAEHQDHDAHRYPHRGGAARCIRSVSATTSIGSKRAAGSSSAGSTSPIPPGFSGIPTATRSSMPSSTPCSGRSAKATSGRISPIPTRAPRGRGARVCSRP